ncbi:hypothetical protein B9T07_26645 [Limnospira fusiformis CCALA 023]
MLAEITVGLNSLKAAMDLVKGLNAAAQQSAVNDVKLALQSHIFEAREALTAANEEQSRSLLRIRQLEEEIARMKTWDAEKQNYELKDIVVGSFTYVLKPSVKTSEPPHWLCAKCFTAGHKSFLQFAGRVDPQGRGARPDHSKWQCSTCNSSILTPWSRSPSNPNGNAS